MQDSTNGPAESGENAHVNEITAIINGTTATFAASSPRFPRRSTSTPTRHESAPNGSEKPVSSFPAASMPAVIADRTMSELSTVTASTAPRSFPNMTEWTSVISPEPSLRPIVRSTAVNANISMPTITGTATDGLRPKKAAISCPLAYPAPIMVPTHTIATEKTFFTV